MPALTIGAVQTEFTADNRKFDVATAGVEKQLEAVGRQAEAAAAKVKSAGDVIDRTAAQQERASERARRAWQQELLAQERATEKEGQLARARELAAIRTQMETRAVNEAAAAKQREIARTRELAEAQERTARLREGLVAGLEMAGVGVGIGFVVDKFKEMVKSTMETGVELGHLSQQTGISVEDLSVLKFAARSTGIEFETLTKGFKKLSTEAFGAVTGSSQGAIKAFGNLGISQAELKAKGNDLYAVLGMISDRFKEMPDGYQKNAIASELFGRAGQQLIPILNQGADAIARYKAQAPIFTDADVDAMEKMHTATVNLGTAWDNVGKSITTAIGPAMTWYVNNFSAGITAIAEKQKSDWQRTKEWFDTLSRIRFGVAGGVVPEFYMAPPKPQQQPSEAGSAARAGAKSGTAAAGAGGGAAAAAAAPGLDTPFTGTSRWAPVTEAMKAYFQQLRADQAAAAAGDAETARIAGERAWSVFQQGAQPDLKAFKANLPTAAAPLADMPDRWKDFRDNMIKTTASFTDLQAQVTQLVDQALRSFNQSLVELATGKKANWAGMFRSLGGSAVSSGLQEIEGKAMSNFSPGPLFTPPGQARSPMSTFLRTIGSLLGLAHPGMSSGPGVGLDASAMTTGYQIPYESMGLLDLPGRALGGPVLAGQAYMVGERGPEPFVPSTSGRIMPHGAMGGGGAYYQIDARGASAAEIDQRVSRALARVHGSAVQSALMVQREHQRRVPSGSR